MCYVVGETTEEEPFTVLHQNMLQKDFILFIYSLFKADLYITLQ